MGHKNLLLSVFTELHTIRYVMLADLPNPESSGHTYWAVAAPKR